MSFRIAVNIAGAGSSDVRKKYLGEFLKDYRRLSKTIGVAATKEMKIRNKSILFQIWGLAGHPRKEETFRTTFHYGRMGFLIFYKKNDRDSFDLKKDEKKYEINAQTPYCHRTVHEALRFLEREKLITKSPNLHDMRRCLYQASPL
ncbi:MAG: hypothetical protein ACXACU_18320 [Candidatus Hodarchaeales archaeon]|jgi:GTPase SAR1 family protein